MWITKQALDICSCIQTSMPYFVHILSLLQNSKDCQTATDITVFSHLINSLSSKTLSKNEHCHLLLTNQGEHFSEKISLLSDRTCMATLVCDAFKLLSLFAECSIRTERAITWD
jgi:hypothetical protein